MSSTEINLKALVNNARSLMPNTRRSYLATVQRWLDFAGGDPAGWTAQQAQHFYEALLSDGIAVRSANNMVTGGLAYVFGRAHALHGIPDVTRAIDKAKDDEDDGSPRHALSPAQGRALLTACKGGGDLLALRDYATCILGFYTGMRRASLVALRLENIAVGHDVVFLKTVVKGGRHPDIPIAPYVWHYLADYRKALDRTEGPLLPRVTQISIKTNQRDASQPMTEDGLYKAILRVAKRAGIPKFTPHIFRHTFTTWCRQAKIEDYLIEVVTAHRSNRGLVDRVYTDRHAMSAEVAARCAAAVDAKLFPKE